MGQPTEHPHDLDPAVFFTQEFWDERYGGERVWSGNPNTQLVRYAADLPPGTALDVGSGEGGDVLWLAGRGWTVTGVDISEVALRKCAEQTGAEIAARVTWQQADVLTWTPPERAFDLVSAQFVHLPHAEREALLRRLGAAVRTGGTLLFVGHHPADLEVEGLRRPHLPGMFATGEQMAAALDADEWAVTTAAPARPGVDADGNPVTLHDAVLCAVRRA